MLGNLPLAFRTPVPFHFLTLKEVNADVIGNVRRTCHQLHEHLRLKKRINTSSTKRINTSKGDQLAVRGSLPRGEPGCLQAQQRRGQSEGRTPRGKHPAETTLEVPSVETWQ